MSCCQNYRLQGLRPSCSEERWVKSLSPRGADKGQETKPLLTQIMACCLIGAKIYLINTCLVPSHYQNRWHVVIWTHTSNDIWIEKQHFSSKKMNFNISSAPVMLLFGSMGTPFSKFESKHRSRKCIWTYRLLKRRPFCFGVNMLIWYNVRKDPVAVPSTV